MLIHVTCPNCAEPYDIADTFAGGVYRCTKCNTLMSVPKPQTTPAALRTGPGMSKSLSPDEAESLSKSKSSGQMSGSKAGARGGKPAAPKTVKKTTRSVPQKSLWDTYKMHFIILGVSTVVLAIAVGVIYKIKSKPKVVTDGVIVQNQRQLLAPPPQQFAYAPGVLTNAKPNVLGLPLIGNVAVIVDGTSDLNPVRADLHKLLIGGLSNKPFGIKAGVVYGNGEAAASPVAPITDTTALGAFLGKVHLTNINRESVDKGLIPALNAAVANIPANRTQQIVLILGRRLTPYMQTKLLTAAEAAVNAYTTHLDIIVVDAGISDLENLSDLVSKSHGRMIQVQSSAIHQAAAK